MSANLISLIGGGITAAATLAVGISTSGILAANPTDIDAGQVPGETVYVEQPIIEVAGVPTPDGACLSRSDCHRHPSSARGS